MVQLDAHLIAIEQGKYVGYSMDGDVGYICVAQFPNAFKVRTLGHDDSYRSDWIEHMSQIRSGPQNSSTLMFEAEVIDLFDQTMFLKSDKIYERSDLWKALKILSNLSEIEFIWLDANRCEFIFGDLRNVTYSLDLSNVSDPFNQSKVTLIFRLRNLVYLQRQNFDLCFTCPLTKSVLVLRGVFKEEHRSDVHIYLNSFGYSVDILSGCYNELTRHKGPISILDQQFYTSVTLNEIYKKSIFRRKIL